MEAGTSAQKVRNSILDELEEDVLAWEERLDNEDDQGDDDGDQDDAE